ncbi:hypothetical protein NDU88_004492 [Pleurodeles waltl]|uniref:Uncharacterized protein n=1 Tax=Pleurodeles waltl TaxID=8319 RepID=A0AAV7T893_PLEWA|nr:hypothetical protein NDU88_004492 [Pleurodeles waltl]
MEQTTPPEELPTTPADAELDQILAAIVKTRLDLRNRGNVMAVDVGLLLYDQRKLTAHITQAESTVDELWPTVSDLEGQLLFLKA